MGKSSYINLSHSAVQKGGWKSKRVSTQFNVHDARMNYCLIGAFKTFYGVLGL
jgi:hypothetical protein